MQKLTTKRKFEGFWFLKKNILAKILIFDKEFNLWQIFRFMTKNYDLNLI